MSGETITELNKSISFSYPEIRVESQTAEVEAVVYKTFNYNICPDVESASSARYSIELIKESNEWEIVVINDFIPNDILFPLESQGLNVNSIMSINNYKNSIEDSIQEYNSSISSQLTSQSMNSLNIQQTTTSNYNESGAVAYANQYVFNPNLNYFNIEAIGGDCTNFASQVMHEGGGIPEHNGSSGYNNCLEKRLGFTLSKFC